MNQDKLIARYFYRNCTVSFYEPADMVVSKKHSLMSRYDIIFPEVLHFDEDFASRFFDSYRRSGEIPSPMALLNISTSTPPKKYSLK